MATKNLGQVAGVHIGTTPPENTKLIWYDSTPSQSRHKTYDPSLKAWTVLSPSMITLITYSELVNIAKGVGLTIGQWFQIKDKGNALALSITPTKAQYCDSLGNILIDDLGTNVQYHVASSNLTIDDISGVFNETSKKIDFTFQENTPDVTDDYFLFGKVKKNNVWHLAKYKISSLLSKSSNNSISWNSGFYFNFSETLKNSLDKSGGVVSKEVYDLDKKNLETSIYNVGKENQKIVEQANKAITEATTDAEIYSKKSGAISTSGEAIDLAQGDTLQTIVGKIQRWINKFKFANGIKISPNFSLPASSSPVNNNDTVESAIAKLQKSLTNFDPLKEEILQITQRRVLWQYETPEGNPTVRGIEIVSGTVGGKTSSPVEITDSINLAVGDYKGEVEIFLRCSPVLSDVESTDETWWNYTVWNLSIKINTENTKSSIYKRSFGQLITPGAELGIYTQAGKWFLRTSDADFHYISSNISPCSIFIYKVLY